MILYSYPRFLKLHFLRMAYNILHIYQNALDAKSSSIHMKKM